MFCGLIFFFFILLKEQKKKKLSAACVRCAAVADTIFCLIKEIIPNDEEKRGKLITYCLYPKQIEFVYMQNSQSRLDGRQDVMRNQTIEFIRFFLMFGGHIEVKNGFPYLRLNLWRIPTRFMIDKCVCWVGLW